MRPSRRACLVVWRHAFFLLTSAGIVLGADATESVHNSTNPQEPLPGIDGDFRAMPSGASDEWVLDQPLGTLLVDPAKIRSIPRTAVRGKIEFLRIGAHERTIRVTMIDSSGAAFFDQLVSAQAQKGDRVKYSFEHGWIVGGEWGDARGTTVATLSRTEDGSLLVELELKSAGRTRQVWVKYPAVTQAGKSARGSSATP